MTPTTPTFNLCPKCGKPLRVTRTTHNRMHIERTKVCSNCETVLFHTFEIHERRHDALLRAEAANIAALNQQPQAQVEAPTPEPLPLQVTPPQIPSYQEHLAHLAEMDRLNAARDFVQQSVAENESEEGKPVDLDDEYPMTDEEAALYRR